MERTAAVRLSGDKLRLLRRQAPAGTDRVLPSSHRPGVVPASEQQRSLWFLDQLIGPGRHSAYNVNVVLRIQGSLSVPALTAALAEIVRRHEVLRTTFRSQDGEPVQVVLPPAAVPVVQRAAATVAEADALLAEAAVTPFRLAGGPLLRVMLVTVAGAGHVLFLGFHHAVFDGWSAGVFSSELSALYEACRAGQPSPLPDLGLQYADYTLWQQGRIKDGVYARELGFWREELAAAPAETTWPPDLPRPPVASFTGAELSVRLPGGLVGRLGDWAKSEHASLFMVLLAAFQVLLSRGTGSTDLCVGTPVSGRSRTELEPLIGYFVNLLAVRGDLSGELSFRDCLRRTRLRVLASFENQEVPFDRLVEQLRPGRDASRAPLVQTVFAVQDGHGARGGGLELPGLDVRFDDVPGNTAKFDLLAVVWPEGDDWVLGIEYATDLYRPETVGRIAGDYLALLESVAADPDRVVLTAREPGTAGSAPGGQPGRSTGAGAAVPGDGGPPRTDTERYLAGLWSDLLDGGAVGRHDNLFDLGAHSFTVMRALSRIKRERGLQLPASAVFEVPTVAAIAARLDGGAVHSSVVPLAGGGTGRPLVLVHPVGGSVLCYADLARGLAGDRPCLGLMARGLDGVDRPAESVEDMAAAYLGALREAGYSPPYVLSGWSMGGTIAYEMARQLGGDAPLVLIDSYPPDFPSHGPASEPAMLAWFAEDLGGTLGTSVPVTEAGLAAVAAPDRLPCLLAAAHEVGAVPPDTEAAEFAGMVSVFAANLGALNQYHPPTGFAGPLAVLRAQEGEPEGVPPDHGWSRWSEGNVVVRTVPGDHYGLLRDPGLPSLVAEVVHSWRA
jgi:thioesterase domain-containing protein